MTLTADTVVQRQFDCYNAHDLDGFMATFAADVEREALPDWRKRPRTARDYVRTVITHIREGMPNLVDRVQTGLSDRGDPQMRDH